MSDHDPSKRLGNLPEAFYDLLGYLVPASLFTLLVAHLFHGNWPADVLKSSASDTFAGQLLVVLVGVGVLYLVGQFATSFSYYVISVPVNYLRAKVLGDPTQADFSILDRWFAARAGGDAGMISEMSKRLARWVMARNVAFLSLLACALCLAVRDARTLAASAIVFVIAITDFTIRTAWLRSSFDAVLGSKKR